MPLAALTPAVATLIAGGGAAAATAYGAHAAGKSASKAYDVQSRSDAAAITENQARDAEAKRQFDIQQQNETDQRSYDRARQDYQDQLMREREQRLAPYRQMSAAALGNLGQLLGLNLQPTSLAQGAAPTPTPPTLGAPSPAPVSRPMMGLPVAPVQRALQDPIGPGGVIPLPTLGDLTGMRRTPSAY